MLPQNRYLIKKDMLHSFVITVRRPSRWHTNLQQDIWHNGIGVHIESMNSELSKIDLKTTNATSRRCSSTCRRAHNHYSACSSVQYGISLEVGIHRGVVENVIVSVVRRIQNHISEILVRDDTKMRSDIGPTSSAKLDICTNMEEDLIWGTHLILFSSSSAIA